MSAFASRAKTTLAGGLVAGLVCAGGAAGVVPAAAQGGATPNRPDFAPSSGVGWLAAGTEFIAMPTGPHPVTSDKAHPYVPNNTGGQPTFRVADLDNPILQPWVVAALKKVNERTLSGKDSFPPQVRCWPLGVPAFVLYPAQPIYFVQTPTEVLMTWQADHMVRRVFLTDKHSANPKPSWFGESIGHYEGGDTLVVRTQYPNVRRQLPHAAHRPAARGRALQIGARRQVDRSRHHGRGSRSIHHAVVGDAALPESRAGPDGRGDLRGRQFQLFQLRPGAAAPGRQARFLSPEYLSARAAWFIHRRSGASPSPRKRGEGERRRTGTFGRSFAAIGVCRLRSHRCGPATRRGFPPCAGNGSRAPWRRRRWHG